MTSSKENSFFLGKSKEGPFYFEAKNFTTHAVILGMTGSGKTGLGIDIIEEAALHQIPVLVIDPKGDLANLMLAFPDLSPQDFLPWVDQEQAEKLKITTLELAEKISSEWEKGQKEWGIDKAKIKAFKESAETVIYTPASTSGLSISILNSFDAPPAEIAEDPSLLTDRIQTLTSGLLGLLNIDTDPLKSKEHILIANLFEKSFKEKGNLSLANLIEQIQNPPLSRLGVFDLETFFPQKERMVLARNLNHLLASPGFKAWTQGEPLDINSFLRTKEGKPKISIFSISHLPDPERMFFVTLFLNELQSWMRTQGGSSNLKCLLYMDEIFGYFPPVANPPSKQVMLSLLKTARAYGLGIVLATQNPVDLDYKGLSNSGTWMIGKLQTEQDKARVIDGLKSAIVGKWDLQTLKNQLAEIGKRKFLLQSIHLSEPVLFETRWTLSYLKGPITSSEIAKLMQTKRVFDVKEYYLVENQQLSLKPYFLAKAKLHFLDKSLKVDYWEDLCFAIPFEKEGKREEITSKLPFLSPSKPLNSTLAAIPEEIKWTTLQNAFKEYLLSEKVLSLYRSGSVVSNPGETKESFENRIAPLLIPEQEKIEAEWQKKIDRVQEKLTKAQNQLQVQLGQAKQQKMNTFISFVSSLIGAFLGRGVTKGTITQVGTSAKQAGKIAKESEDVARAQENLARFEEESQELYRQKNEALDQLRSMYKIEEISLHLNESDIELQEASILWKSPS